MVIEVERSTSPSLSRGFGQACDDLGITPRWVVCPGTERFPMRQGAQAVGVVEMATVATG